MFTVETGLDRIEIDNSGSVAVRLLKRVCNGETVMLSEPHRVLIPAGGDVTAIMQAVNAHLEAMGFPACGAAAILNIKSHADLAAQGRMA